MRLYIKLLIIFMLWGNVGCATTYYCGTGQAQTTITQVNALSQVSGDTVSFNCGETFNDAVLNAVAGVTYNSYGTGDKPLFNRSASDYNIYVNKDDSVTIDGLQFDGGKAGKYLIYIYDSNSISITDCDFTSATPDYAIFGYYNVGDGSAYSDITIDGCTFTGVGQEAAIRIYQAKGSLGLSNITITDNTITNSPDDGIYIFSEEDDVGDLGNEADTVVISRNTLATVAGYGIHVNPATNLTVSDNTLTDIGNLSMEHINAIQLNGINTGTIEGNSVTNVVTTLPDGCGIILDYAYGDDEHLSTNLICRNNYVTGCLITGGSGINAFKVTNSFIYNNKVYNNDSGFSLMNDESTGNVFYNNTIHTSTDRGFSVKLSAPASIFKNNIIHTSDYGIRVEGGSTNPTEDYNSFYNNTTSNFYNNTTGEVSIGSHSLTSNPLLNSDYTIPYNSPCKDSGVNLSDVTDDYIGSPRPMGVKTDIGIYEFFNTKI